MKNRFIFNNNSLESNKDKKKKENRLNFMNNVFLKLLVLKKLKKTKFNLLKKTSRKFPTK